ncbi:MAG: hypothetical protein ABI759_28820 [Candidatus Solibacter sp.]
MQALAIFFGALFTCAVSLAIGGLLLRDACRDAGVRFVAGAAVLSLLVFLLCAAGLAYPVIFAVAGLAAVAIALRRGGGWGTFGGGIPAPRWLWGIAFGAFAVLYLSNAMAPEISPDGSAYHLGLVGRYLREHGFSRPESLYAALPGGVEMLFLWAYAFGRHSAAALTHFAFLLALAWQIFAYARGRGFAVAGMAAALIVFASPVIGIDGTSAYNDVALSAIGFTLFHLLQIWDESRDPRLLWAIGLTAGFAFAAKYTAWPALVYAVGFVLVKQRKAVIPVAGSAALLAGPWLLKNWIYVHNPLAPFYNQLISNSFVTVDFEETYRRLMALYHLKSRWEIPMQVTVHGTLSGLLGPFFLLAPLGLLALRKREGRQLWLAALVFGVNYFSNIAARFLIPPAPFVALAVTIGLSAVPHLAVAVAMITAVLSWPAMVSRYADPAAWRLARIPWHEALRLWPEERYLDRYLTYYDVDRMIEAKTEPDATVFSFVPVPEAYTSRRVRVEYQSAANQIAGKILWTALAPEFVPTWRLRFRFPEQAVRGLRVVQTASGGDFWSAGEFRVYRGDLEIPRTPVWRLTARPYPWGVQDAFDNSLATFWICGEKLKPGQFVQVDFHEEAVADSVELEAAPNQWAGRWKLEGLDAGGKWRVLSPAPVASDAPRPLGLRRAVTQELKRRGIDYLLVFDTDNGADDLRLNTDLWGLRAVGSAKQARLYRLE